MTKKEAKEYWRDHDDDTATAEGAADAFTALYERPPDEQDEHEGVWSHVCAYFA